MSSPKIQRVLSTTAVVASQNRRHSVVGFKNVTHRQTSFCYTVNPIPETKQPKSFADSLKCCTIAMFPAASEPPTKYNRVSSISGRRSSLHPHDLAGTAAGKSDSPEHLVSFGQVDFCQTTPVKVKSARRTSLGNFIQKIKQNDILNSHSSSRQKLDVSSTTSTPSHSNPHLSSKDYNHHHQHNNPESTVTKLISSKSGTKKHPLKTQRSNSMTTRSRSIFGTGSKHSAKNSCERLNENVDEGAELFTINNIPTELLVSEMRKGFINVLKSQSALPLFHQFLMKEFSEENLEFWMDVEQYRQIDNDQARQQKALQIYNTFVSECAHKQVNMDARLHSDIKCKLARDCSSSLFNDAQAATFKLMERDSYKRFLENLNEQASGKRAR
ncbi:uncharacterized protein LOC142339176 isoform X1 [Convolutriloba macropyga]|uniref:uncharacterized protein LOC142339176 isoform X1 n=1 Tax=Convolutriloba macropyga TaxID=536237 RepID=UPI003F526A88